MIAGWNPAEGMDVRLLCLFVVCYRARVFMSIEAATVRRPRPELGCCVTKQIL